MTYWVARHVAGGVLALVLFACLLSRARAQDVVIDAPAVAAGEEEEATTGAPSDPPILAPVPESRAPLRLESVAVDAVIDAPAEPAPSSYVAEDPEPAPSRRRLHVGHLVANAIVGDLVGGAAGALVSLAIAGGIGCRAGESSWLSGFQCSAGFLYAAAIGALYGAAIGGPLGVLRVGGARDGGGDAGLAMLGALLGVGVGSIMTGVLVETTQEPTAALAIGGGLGVLVSTFSAALLYDGSRPTNDADALQLSLLAIPLEGGVLLGVGGQLR